MPGTPFRTVDEYIASKPAAAQETLNQVRSAIRKAIPRAKVNGRAALYFAGWSRFYSIYPASKILLEAFGENSLVRRS